MYRKIASFTAVSVILAGCASSGSNYNEARVADIREGQTTEAELRQMLGKPTGQSFDSSGTKTLTWSYSESRINGKSFIPFAGHFLGGSDSESKMLIVSLDPSGTVKHFNGSGNEMDVRGHAQDTPD